MNATAAGDDPSTGGGKTEDDGDVEDNEGSKHGGKGAEEDEDSES